MDSTTLKTVHPDSTLQTLLEECVQRGGHTVQIEDDLLSLAGRGANRYILVDGVSTTGRRIAPSTRQILARMMAGLPDTAVTPADLMLEALAADLSDGPLAVEMAAVVDGEPRRWRVSATVQHDRARAVMTLVEGTA